MNVNAG